MVDETGLNIFAVDGVWGVPNWNALLAEGVEGVPPAPKLKEGAGAAPNAGAGAEVAPNAGAGAEGVPNEGAAAEGVPKAAAEVELPKEAPPKDGVGVLVIPKAGAAGELAPPKEKALTSEPEPPKLNAGAGLALFVSPNLKPVEAGFADSPNVNPGVAPAVCPKEGAGLGDPKAKGFGVSVLGAPKVGVGTGAGLAVFPPKLKPVAPGLVAPNDGPLVCPGFGPKENP